MKRIWIFDKELAIPFTVFLHPIYRKHRYVNSPHLLCIWIHQHQLSGSYPNLILSPILWILPSDTLLYEISPCLPSFKMFTRMLKILPSQRQDWKPKLFFASVFPSGYMLTSSFLSSYAFWKYILYIVFLLFHLLFTLWLLEIWLLP